jgi:acetoacetyl-CoA synthetase
MKIIVKKLFNRVTLAEFIAEAAGDESDSDAAELKFEQVPFYHPMVILFSSGTTGTPKCIVHSHGGTLIQHLKEHILQGNMTSDDIVFYYTTVSSEHSKSRSTIFLLY